MYQANFSIIAGLSPAVFPIVDKNDDKAAYKDEYCQNTPIDKSIFR